MTPSPVDAAGLDEAASLLTSRPIDVDRVLTGLKAQRAAGIGRHFFYPVARDINFDKMKDFYDEDWNNLGSRHANPPGGNHTKSTERALLAWAADLFEFPADDWWGNITTGGTAGNRAGLLTARNSFPRTLHGVTCAVAYYSASAHYSIPDLLDELNIPSVRVNTDQYGEMDYEHLAQLVHPGVPAIVVATAGTTMTEAVDDPMEINAVLDALGIMYRHLHVDAALSGIPLALDGALRTAEVHSIAVSGYKFLGVRRISGMVLGRNAASRRQQHISYISSVDDAPHGSIDGLPALAMWYAVATIGDDGHRARARAARDLAAYATDQLNSIDWPAWRHDHGFTVVFPTPPKSITDDWPIASDSGTGQSHLICMPGVQRHQVDEFVAELATATRHMALRQSA